MAVDAAGVVYVAMSRGGTIQTFTRQGEFLGEWGASELGSPGALAFDGAGNLLVADTGNRRIERFTPEGAFLGQFDGEASSLAVDSSGSIYAADPANDRVRKYAADGTLLAELTESPAPPGRFVYVTDLRNYRVQMFTSRGGFLGKWGRLGAGDGEFSGLLGGLGVSMGGELYVADGGNHRVQAFRPVLHVRLDVKPGSAENNVNPASRGRIPVAILSTADFDAPARIDRASLSFGRTGEEASLASCNRGGEDVNRDGRVDLVCHFTTQTAGFQAGDTEGLLKGTTTDGHPVGGRDSVRMFP